MTNLISYQPPLKIAMVFGPYITVPPVNYGGTERVGAALLEYLALTDHKVYLVASGDSTGCSVNSRNTCEVYATCEQSLGFAQTPEEFDEHQKLVDESNNRLKQHIIDLVNQENIDIIHSHYNAATDIIRELMDEGSIPVTPIITTLHGPYEMDQAEFFEKNGHLAFNTISWNQRAGYPNDINWAANIYNGQNPEHYPFVQTPEDYFCFVGRFDEQKAPHLAIKFALSFDTKIKLAGKVDHIGSRYFEEEIVPFLDHELVEYLGELSIGPKAKLMGNAIMNLHPTGFREPFGLTLVEAAFTGTPTIANDLGAIPEIIEVIQVRGGGGPGRTGIIVQEFNEACKLYPLEAPFIDRNYVSQRARMLFNHEVMTKSYIQAYYRVIDQTK
jgi:glycosyltransferase involved in cell wall biosynthesis